MTHGPMPDTLLLQLASLAKSRHIESPTRILARDAAEKAAREPKRPRYPYWLKDIHIPDGEG